MEQNNEYNRCGYTRVGYAATRHPHESRNFGRQVHFGYCVASLVLCSRERTGKHKGAASRGNKNSERKGRPFRSPFFHLFGRIFIRRKRLSLQAYQTENRFAVIEYKSEQFFLSYLQNKEK